MGFDDRALEDFSTLRFDGEVWAVPEGRVVYSEEPMLEVTAPVAVAQVVETVLLNQITLHTTLASKAARYVLAAEGRQLVDFAFRRTHGVEAAEAIARASALVGVRRDLQRRGGPPAGLEVAGTMAHSFVEAFPTEGEAFRAFAEDHPSRTTFLVDTYDTRTACAPRSRRSAASGSLASLGVRLDSGDLDVLARGARALLDDAGLPQARIFASGGLDELEVHELVRAGAPGRRVRDRHPDGRVRRRPVRRLGLQARGVRRAADDEALVGEGDRRPVASRSGAVRGARTTSWALRDEPGPGPAPSPCSRP